MPFWYGLLQGECGVDFLSAAMRTPLGAGGGRSSCSALRLPQKKMRDPMYTCGPWNVQVATFFFIRADSATSPEWWVDLVDQRELEHPVDSPTTLPKV